MGLSIAGEYYEVLIGSLTPNAKNSICEFERSGEICEFDPLVVQFTLELLEKTPDLHLAVNISRRTIIENSGAIYNLLEQYADVAQRLIVEITETPPGVDIDKLIIFSQKVLMLGCAEVAIDDIEHWDISTVRRMFDQGGARIAKIGHPDRLKDTDFRAILGPGVIIIVEGVEDLDTLLDICRNKAEVTLCQGFFVGRPHEIPGLHIRDNLVLV